MSLFSKRNKEENIGLNSYQPSTVLRINLTGSYRNYMTHFIHAITTKLSATHFLLTLLSAHMIKNI